MTLGERIKERRQALGFTQQDLANVTQVTIQHMSAIEQDKRFPSVSLFIRLAEKLGVSLDYLILGKEAAIDTIAAIEADPSLDVEMKKSLVHLVTVMREARKNK